MARPAVDNGTAKTKKKASGGGAPDKLRFDDYRFCRIEMTADEKADCKADYLPNETPIGVLTDLALPGYKVSHSHQNDGNTHICSISCTDPADQNAGLTISARAGDIGSAIMVLGYKVFVLCDDKPWAQVEHERGGTYDAIG